MKSARYFFGQQKTAETKHWIDYATLVAATVAAFAGTLAAHEASKQSRVAALTAQRQLRAYLSLQYVPDAIQPTKTDFAFDVRNSGQTPAYNVRVMMAFEQDKLTKGQKDSGNLVGGKNQLGSTETYGLSLEKQLDEEKISHMIKNKSSNYIYGKLLYKDIFDVEHQDIFCFYYFVRESRDVFVVPCNPDWMKPDFEH